jgi:hypothetical protein
MFCSSLHLSPSSCVSYEVREYFRWIGSLQHNGCFSLSARVSSLHPCWAGSRASHQSPLGGEFAGRGQPVVSSPLISGQS